MVVDEVQIFSRALLQSEIQDIYNAGSKGKCKPPCEPLPDGSGCTNTGCDCFGECINGSYCDTPDCCCIEDPGHCYTPNHQASIKRCGDCFGECQGGSYCDDPAHPSDCWVDPAGPACYVPSHHYSIYLCGDCFGQCINGSYCDGPDPDCCIAGPGACKCYSPEHPISIKMCGEQDDCRPSCVHYDPATQITLVTDCDCGGATECHATVPQPSAGPPTCVDGCPPGEVCEQSETHNADATVDICCRCVTPCVPAPSGMVAWWALDEPMPPTAFDSAGHNDATYVIGPGGSPTPTPFGKVDGALQFISGSTILNCVSGYAQAAGAPFNFLGNSDFSIDAWVKLPLVGGGEFWIVDRTHDFHLAATGPQGAGIHLGYACGHEFWPTLPPLDTWFHVAVTVARGQQNGLKMYYNGALDGTANACNYSVNYGTIPLGLGCGTSDGELDEVEIFDRVLTEPEVLAIYEAGSGGKCKCEPLPDGSGCTTSCPDPNAMCGAQPSVQIILGPAGTPFPLVTDCTCDSACGPVSVKNDPGTGDYALSCFGNCPGPSICEVFLNGVPQGLDTVFTQDLMPGDIVTCECNKEHCGPGDHWIDKCPGGTDYLDGTSLAVAIDLDRDPLCLADDLDGDGIPDVVKFTGDAEILRGAGQWTSLPHSMPTTMTSMTATSTPPGLTLTVGAPLTPSVGGIIEKSDPAVGYSYFDVFFELALTPSGPYLYNQSPCRVEAQLTKVPPKVAVYTPLFWCLPLWSSPTPGTGIHVANLAAAFHGVGVVIAQGACFDGNERTCIDVAGLGDCLGAQQVFTPNTLCAALTGACCDTLTGTCEDEVLLNNCESAQQEWNLDATCAEVACDPTPGACCDQDVFGTCSVTTVMACDCKKCVWHKELTCDDIECLHNPIPTVSQWGLVVLTLLLLIGAKIYFARRETATAPW